MDECIDHTVLTHQESFSFTLNTDLDMIGEDFFSCCWLYLVVIWDSNDIVLVSFVLCILLQSVTWYVNVNNIISE